MHIRSFLNASGKLAFAAVLLQKIFLLYSNINGQVQSELHSLIEYNGVYSLNPYSVSLSVYLKLKFNQIFALLCPHIWRIKTNFDLLPLGIFIGR